MKDGHIVALGRVCIDEYYQLDAWPKMGEKKFVLPLNRQVGGMIANAASVLAGYGVHAYLLDELPDTDSTDQIRKDLKRYHIDDSFVQIIHNISDTKCLIFLEHGERTIFVTDVTRPKIKISRELWKVLDDAAYLYTTIPDLMELECWESVITRLQANGVKIAIDVEANSFDTPAQLEQAMKFCTTVFFNGAALEKYAGSRSEEDALVHLMTLGPEHLVVTKGVQGCIAANQTQTLHMPAYRVEAVDTTGAGDTFNSTFLYCIMRGYDLTSCARFSSAAAARAITIMGPRAGVAPFNEVLSFAERTKIYGNPANIGASRH